MQPVDRFTHRAALYAKYRPGYPDEVVAALELPAGALVADIAAGTGISSELFLRHGYRVIGIEPNAAMRAAALERGIDCREGTAEATGLPDACADVVVCAQAFHWVDHFKARDEFLRIAKPGGRIAILWNLRVKDGTPFLRGLEELVLRLSPEYANKVVRDTDYSVINVERIFAPLKSRTYVFRHAQVLDMAGLEGRMLSTSYVPMDDEGFVRELRRLFDETNDGGTVTLEYECRLIRCLKR